MKVDSNISLRKQSVRPRLNVAQTRLFLTHLIDGSFQDTIDYWTEVTADPIGLANWIIDQEIGPFVYHRFQMTWPELARHLKEDAFAATAENSLHFERLGRVRRAFHEAQIPFVLLKGAALAHVCYPAPTLRTMSDIDIWVQPAQMAQAYQVMQTLGFRAVGHPRRPPKLQLLYQGEIQFYDQQQGLIELHWAPVSGWQVQNTTTIETDALWARKRALDGPLAGAYVLASEDMVIQLALHTAINHRFRLTAVRSFVDIALLAQTTAVSWPVVAERAIRWRVATAVYCTLNLVQILLDPPGIEAALAVLRPSRLRRFALNRFVSVESILQGDETLGEPMQNNRMGYLFLMFLIDRPVDAVKLLGQAVWPSREWLEARYGPAGSRRRHWLHLLRRGQV